MRAQVYHPCILQAKKRYVGFAYEAPNQGAPIFDAKGIETVRRDTCGAVAKMLERCLRILFTCKDISQVRALHASSCTLFACLGIVRGMQCQTLGCATYAEVASIFSLCCLRAAMELVLA